MRSSEQGMATLETTLMIVVLLPVLFAILEFGDAFHRWMAQDAATMHAARYAAEVGGDTPEVRARLAEALRDAGIDPDHATVEIAPPRVGWREPITVTVRTDATIAIPFALTTVLPLRSTAVARGELAR
ncbi:MAG TPA: TadE/TadG family type IV pilus assembly protein [Gaiellaceae bacterium]|nr:TadE/TadG family type IV pilus assembly protein [Gaiellaceae bacterium]